MVGEGVASATPIDSGQTANSWYYKIIHKNGSVSTFYNFKYSKWSSNSQLILIWTGTRKAGYRVEITSILLSSLFFDKIKCVEGGY